MSVTIWAASPPASGAPIPAGFLGDLEAGAEGSAMGSSGAASGGAFGSVGTWAQSGL